MCAPFRNILIDHIGPFHVKCNSKQVKVYILIITDTWSRAINLFVCKSIDKYWFLRSLQLHIFEFGIPSLIISDNGSPIKSGVEQTVGYLNDPDTREFLEERNIKMMSFRPYPAGASKLGGLVESLVKEVKRILTSSIRNNVLDLDDFEFLVSETKMLVNKRPILIKDSNTDVSETKNPVFTPELVVKGYDVPSIAIIPQLNSHFDDSDFSDELLDSNQKNILKRYEKLAKVRTKLVELYRDEFISDLFNKATDRKNRYALVNHRPLELGDVVTIKTANCKPYQYPLAVVVGVETNDLNETTAASLRKSNGEIVRRHADNIIFIAAGSKPPDTAAKTSSDEETCARPKRKAALISAEKTKTILNN